MKSPSLKHTEKTNLPFSGLKATLPTFRTKKDAMVEAKKFGWKNAVRMMDRFEEFWVVGELCFQPVYVAKVKHDLFRFPMLKWKRNKSGVQFCPVIEVQRVSEK